MYNYYLIVIFSKNKTISTLKSLLCAVVVVVVVALVVVKKCLSKF